MNPTFMNIDADFNKEYYDKGYIPATMGCRTYLMKNVNGEPGCKGRGNIAPITINLPRIGIEANKDINKFFEILQNRLTLAKEALLHRYSILKKLKVKDLPFVAGQGLMRGSEDLMPDDSIEPILKQGTWAIGFIGLAETLYALIGSHNGETDEARNLGLKIIKFIREYTDKLVEETQLNWSCYATPAEGLSGKFIKKDKKIYGIIKGVTDKEYYTNSFHIPVNYNISIKDKIDIEAPYHKLCNAGHISYIELDDSPSPEVIMEIINYAYKRTNISYIGINFHIRYCKECGTSIENNLNSCPKCNSKNIQGISRVTGYLSLDERFGPGKYEERLDRRSHTGNYKNNY
jgi:anaerobic ribonucleoside-triphosphate reductase